jgi:hypothetical protein
VDAENCRRSDDGVDETAKVSAEGVVGRTGVAVNLGITGVCSPPWATSEEGGAFSDGVTEERVRAASKRRASSNWSGERADIVCAINDTTVSRSRTGLEFGITNAPERLNNCRKGQSWWCCSRS